MISLIVGESSLIALTSQSIGTSARSQSLTPRLACIYLTAVIIFELWCKRWHLPLATFGSVDIAMTRYFTDLFCEA